MTVVGMSIGITPKQILIISFILKDNNVYTGVYVLITPNLQITAFKKD